MDSIKKIKKGISNGLAEVCFECIQVSYSDPLAKQEIMRGGGSNGGIVIRLLNPRPLQTIRISKSALEICLNKGIIPYDFFLLSSKQFEEKYPGYSKFHKSNTKDVAQSHSENHYLIGDHNIPNKAMLEKMYQMYSEDNTVSIDDFREILDEQSLDYITVEENQAIKDNGFESAGSKTTRDKFCSEKIEFVDVRLTPENIIDKFFAASHLNKDECLDPCACDGRWLGDHGMSIDVLPMKKGVIEQDYLLLQKNSLPPQIKHVVGSIPSPLAYEFVVKSLLLTGDCYFLTGETFVFERFSKNIKNIYVFREDSGVDYIESKCGFELPCLLKSKQWSFIVHITAKKQQAWTLEKDLSINEKRDGNHVAIGDNCFIRTANGIENEPRITIIDL